MSEEISLRDAPKGAKPAAGYEGRRAVARWAQRQTKEVRKAMAFHGDAAIAALADPEVQMLERLILELESELRERKARVSG